MTAERAERIVVLDGYPLNPGDLSWDPLRAHGQLTVYDRSGDASIERAKDADIVLTNKEIISAEFLKACPRVRYVGVLATGTNVVDLKATIERNIVVTNVPGYGTASVAQHVFALLLHLTNHVAEHGAAVRDGRWERCPDFSFTVAPIRELSGKTFGIIGLGAIGTAVGRLAAAFGMHVLAAKHATSRTRGAEYPVQWLDLEQLFRTADVLSLHCPLTDTTRHIINREHLRMMKSSSILINAGRGGLVDEQALLEALSQRRIAAAALDVLGEEPPRSPNPLVESPDCVVTPHVAWASREARQRLMQIAADNIAAFLAGRAQNVVPAAG